MFQTEPILALQRLEWLRFPMWFVSQLGYTPFFILLLLAIVYMVDFKKGLVAIQVVSWNGILTNFLKGFFALPRPDAVDSRVLLDGAAANPVQFEKMGAPGFFDPLPRQIVSHYRSLGDFSYGFPSGHCSSTASAWGSMALLFREPAVRALAVLMILLMPVSRMYLGRHFLAGGLGGVAQGLLVVTAGWFVIIRSFAGFPSVADSVRTLEGAGARLVQLAYFFALPLAVMTLPGVEVVDCARLLGINLGWVLLARRGLPRNGGSAPRRLARFVLAVVCFVIVLVLAGRGAEAVFGGESDWTESVAYFSATLSTLWGATELGVRMRLFAGRR